MKSEQAHSRTCDREECIVCRDWREEKRAQARPYLIARAFQTDSRQTTIPDYE